MQHYTPAAPAVRETLERLLASETFGRSERARELLSYLVERQLAGEADRLKGFSIAVDVFGKDADFDSATDAVVRVQAGRLRDLLTQYFSGEGSAEPIRIVIARGSYIPAYEFNEDYRLPETAAELEDDKERPPSPPPLAGAVLAASPSLMRQLQFLWVAIGLVIAMLGFLVLHQGGLLLAANPGTVANANDAATVTASIAAAKPDELPAVYMAVTANDEPTARAAALLRAGLSGFDTIDFIGRDLTGEPDVADATSFVFKVASGPDAGTVSIELQNVPTGRVLNSRILTAAEASPARIEDNVAGILSMATSPSGMIYGYIEQENLQTGLTQCLLLDDDYYMDQNATTHDAAYRCFEKLANRSSKSPLVYSELASLHLETVTDGYAYPPNATQEQAMAFAQRAIQMGTTSPFAYRAYGYMNSRLGNSEEATRWLRKAYELNTYDLSMAASYAYGLIFAGDYRQGTRIMARAVEAASAHPPWWDFGLFAGEFMLGKTAKAMSVASTLAPTALKSHYLSARLIAAHYNGDEAARIQLLDELMTRFPKFCANPRHMFAKRNYPADLTDRLVEALRAAGLGNGA